MSIVQSITGTNFPAANRLVARLVDLGILDEITGDRRNRVYRYTPYLQILEPTTPKPTHDHQVALTPHESHLTLRFPPLASSPSPLENLAI